MILDGMFHKILESRLKIMGRVETADVSEEQAVRCTYSSTYNGCNGGHGSAALTYLWFKMNGASNESQYPYTATGGECQSNLQLKYPVQASRAYRSIVNYWSSYNENNRDEIKKALEKGPVMGVIYASSAFDNYKSGVFHCSLADRTAHNHQIVIIGYQDPIPNKDYADGYWLIKNSWGATWGESGFAKISMDINYDCGIAKWEVDAPVMIQDVTIFTMAPSSTETIAVATLIKTNQKPFESASATVEAILITIGIFGSAGVVAVVLYFKRLER